MTLSFACSRVVNFSSFIGRPDLMWGRHVELPVQPVRWVVERSFVWLEKCRRLWKNCERKLNTSLQMATLAFLVLLLRRL